jgi:hypothetical protein
MVIVQLITHVKGRKKFKIVIRDQGVNRDLQVRINQGLFCSGTCLKTEISCRKSNQCIDCMDLRVLQKPAGGSIPGITDVLVFKFTRIAAFKFSVFAERQGIIQEDFILVAAFFNKISTEFGIAAGEAVYLIILLILAFIKCRMSCFKGQCVILIVFECMFIPQAGFTLLFKFIVCAVVCETVIRVIDGIGRGNFRSSAVI